MSRTALGVTVGLAIWFGSAMAAEAQGPAITPTGPMAIHVGASGATYTATIELPSLQDYGIQLCVYRGNSPTAIWSNELWHYGPTQLTNYYTMGTCWSPNAFLGQKYTFKAKLILASGIITANPVVIFVTYPPPGPGTYLLPSKSTDLAFEAIDRDRRREA